MKYDEKKSNKMDDQLKAFMSKSAEAPVDPEADNAANEAAAPELEN